MSFKHFSLATLFVIIGAIAATAQEQAPATSIDENAKPYEFEFTIIDDLLNQPIYAPFRQEGTVKESTRPTYVINRKQIEAQGYRTVNEALKYFPGVFIDGTAGTSLGAQSLQIMRGGTNSAQTLILLDGRPINLFDSGAFDLSNLTTDNVERIELIPSGGSTLFGSNAIGGVINIVTRKPELNQGLTADVGTEFGGFGFNQQKITVSYGQENQAFRIAYDRTAADNNYGYDVAGFSGTRENSAANIQNLNLQALTKIGDRNTLRFNGIYSSKDLGVPGSVDTTSLFSGPTPNAHQYDENWLLSLDLESQLGNDNNSTLNTKFFADISDLYFHDRNDFGTTKAQYNNTSFGTQIQHNWQFTKQQNITYGFDYRYMTTLTTGDYASYDKDLSQGAIFARYAADVTPELAVNLGLRQDFNSLASGSFTSPSAGFRWQAAENTSIRGNYARNFRVPTALDLYYPGYSNPNLTPEIGNSFDFGVDQKISDRALLRLTYFNNTISDAIVFDSATYIPENIGKIRNQGLEAELTVQLTKTLHGFANYTLNNSEIFEDSDPTVIGKEVRFAGTDFFNVGLAYENPQGVYVGLFVKNVGDRLTNNANTSSLKPYTNVDLRARYPISKNVNLTASWENIFNTNFETYPAYPGVGSRFQIGINAKFH